MQARDKWILKDRQQAYTCPSCGEEGGSSIEHRDFEIHDNILTEDLGWFCIYCSAAWNQTIVHELGKTLSNTAELL